MKRYLIILIFLISVGNVSGQWLTGYSYRKAIEINSDNVFGTENLVDYTFLFSTVDSDLRSVSNNGLISSEDAWDISFTDTDGTTILDHEVELYTASTGELVVWIRIPSLSYLEDTKIYMYFGNELIDANTSSSSTWSTDFRGVWHFNDDVDDASQYSNNGINDGTTSAIGKIGKARSFDGIDDVIVVPNNASLNFQESVSIEAWVKIQTAIPGHYWATLTKLSDYGLNYLTNDLRFYSGEYMLQTALTLNIDEWYYISTSYNRTVQRTYVNGIEVGSVANTTQISNDVSADLGIGHFIGDVLSYFSGYIDEVKLLSVAKSDGWMKTSYFNQNTPDLFSSDSDTEIANDFPCNSIMLDVESTCNALTFSNELASNSGLPLTECSGYTGNDLWFKIEVPPSGDIVVKLESGTTLEIPEPSDWLLQPGLAVYSGDCSNLVHDTCWIDPSPGAPFDLPEIVLEDYTPGDTLHLRVWAYNNSIGNFRICATEHLPEVFNVIGSGNYCSGSSGIPVSIDESEIGANYQLKKNGLDEGVSIAGTGSAISWGNQLEGIYEVSATLVSSGLSINMDDKAIIAELPLPVVNFGYGFEKTISINAEKITGTLDLIHFPMLVSILNDPDLKTVDNGGNVQNMEGYDIVFTDENYNPIPFERISYDPVNGGFSAWVNVPVISPNINTDIQILYGKEEVISDHSSFETWNSDYVQVMHLNGDFEDASLSGNYGLNDGSSDITGKLGSARSFDGIDDKIIVFDDPSLDATNTEATLSLWIKYTNAADGDHQLVMSTENRYSDDGYEWSSQGGGNHFFYPNGRDGSNYNLGPNPFTDGVWHYLTTTLNYDLLDVSIYIDGVPMVFTIENVPSLWTEPAVLDNWLWGGNPDIITRYFDGSMDEIRVQTAARSQDWILAEYTNQNNPSDFYSVSVESPYEALADVCLNEVPFVIGPSIPLGGSFTGTGVTDGMFYPEIAGTGDHTITYSYSDGNGCVSSGSNIQTVHPIPAPIISGNSSLCPNSLSEIYSTPAVIGNSYTWVLSGEGASITSGQSTNEITVDWGTSSGTVSVHEIIDATGCDSTTDDFTVTIVDIDSPDIICADDRTEYVDANCEFVVPDYISLSSVYGNCVPVPVVTQSPPAGAILNTSGTIQEIILMADFGGGNEYNCSLNILVMDTISPMVISLRDTSVSISEGIFEADIIMPVPVFFDNCGIQSIINDFNGGAEASGIYSFGTTDVIYTVTDINNNSAQFNQYVEVKFENGLGHELGIPEGFSPNEDGWNDKFVILGIEAYPDIELRVFNVYGKEVYYKNKYDNSWDGSSSRNFNNGVKLPNGNYYYVIYLDKEGSLVKGSVYLRRE